MPNKKTIAKKSYQTASLKRNFMSKESLITEDFIIYSSDHTKIMGLNMGLVNQRQCYTRLQKMLGSDDFIFRGKHFEKSGEISGAVIKSPFLPKGIFDE